jgi:hypothetical protein
MNRRTFIKNTAGLSAYAAFVSGLYSSEAFGDDSKRQNKLVVNPYENVDWSKAGQHKAALHTHTIQSDGNHWVDEAVNCYRRAGYSIMAITDHDTHKPNAHVAPSGRAVIPAEMASPYPREPKPANFPANPTWPWTDYGCSAPDNLDMVGIEANELTNEHHINSYFNNAGWNNASKNPIDKSINNWNDYELETVRDNGGLAILCHPGWMNESHRKPLEWYIGRFKMHPSNYLLGVEVTNNDCFKNEPYDIGLWDQLLVRFMPQRPIWGFGNDDMHGLYIPRQTFNVFLLDALTSDNVRKAMETGQFIFCKSTRHIDYSKKNFNGLDTYPRINEIAADTSKGTITIEAEDCDEIRWISAPKSFETKEDYVTSLRPWETGNVVHTGSTLDYRNTPGIKNYVRAELVRKDGEHTQRTFTNPFGFIIS